jgi:hypothetical protein
MARANNSPGSPYVLIACSSTGPGVAGGSNRQLAYQYRDAQDGVTTEPAGNAGRASNNATCILRLERSTNTVIVGGFDNQEGDVQMSWQSHDAPNIPTSAPILVGLALTSHLTGVEARCVYTQVARTGNFALVAVPAAPSNLTAQIISNRVLLGWTDNSNNESGFKLERKTASTAYAEIAQPGANATSYWDTSVTVGETYTYRIRASNAGGDSAYSNEIAITVTAVLGVQRWSLYSE